MRRFALWILVTMVAIACNSCGLPGAVARTASNTVNTLGNTAMKTAQAVTAY